MQTGCSLILMFSAFTYLMNHMEFNKAISHKYPSNCAEGQQPSAIFFIMSETAFPFLRKFRLTSSHWHANLG